MEKCSASEKSTENPIK